MNDTTVLASAAQKATRALKKSDIELMAEDWLEELHRYKACGTPTAAQDVAVSICKLACEALPDQNMQYDLEGFVVMVEVLKEMEGLVSSTNLIELGTLIMMKRPYCPCNALCNKPVEANDSTQTVIELFGLLSKHAIEGFDSPNCVNVAHLLRQVLAQNAQTMTVEQMRPFLERSPTMTWECQGSVSHLGVYQGAALAFFENQHELSTKAFYVVPNQAWIALLNNSFPEGTEGCTPDDVLMGATSAERFDQLAGKILEIAKAGIKVEMRLSDVVLIAQILERMTHIANEEAGTQRGQRYATAVVSLIDIVIPRYEKLNTKNCIYNVNNSKKLQPMYDKGHFNTCTLKALKATAIPLQYPEAMEALENFRYQVLLHTVTVSPVLHNADFMKDFKDDVHIAALADLCSASLKQDKALNPINEAGQLLLVRVMNEGPVRRQLMVDNMKIRTELFKEDLGL